MENTIISAEFNQEDCLSFQRIRSFSCRQGRLTKGQKYALDNYWPLMGIEFREYPLNYTELFGCETPITLEIGFGMGSSLVKTAKENPEKTFIGIEVYFPGVGSCLASAYKEKIKNLRVICHDAVEVLHKMIPNNSLSVVQLFFPDPWHKTRHNKRRILQIPFAELVKSKLKLNGIFHIVTDWKPYAEHILKVMSSLDVYKNQSASNDYVKRSELRPLTKFEQRAYSLGNPIWELMFERVSSSKEL